MELASKRFWQGKRVLITGHTGFKGSWLTMMLDHLGAHVFGYSINYPTDPCHYLQAELDKRNSITSFFGDINDQKTFAQFLLKAQPDVVFHMAAQPIVSLGYKNPVETFSTNVMGTVKVLDALKEYGRCHAIVNITSDKCYENKEWVWGYRETDSLCGSDPYSNSKSCAELVAFSYYQSFFKDAKIGLASARAGNVIGGGEWAADRIIADLTRAYLKKEKAILRRPDAVRPWQHVLEPLSGYLLLAQRLYEKPQDFSSPWNFGPLVHETFTVKKLNELFYDRLAYSGAIQVESSNFKETQYLKVDSSKANSLLNWQPRWGVVEAINKIATWVRAFENQENIYKLSISQIEEYLNG